MHERVLRCYVRGRDHRWEAMCIDLDIAVEGCSRSDVASKLEDAVADYIRAVQLESPADADRLLRRRSPFDVRWSAMTGAFVHFFLRSRAGGDLRGSFELACPA